MKKCFLLITVVLLLCACTPSAGAVQTAIAQTQGPITQTQMSIAQTQTFAPTLTNIDTQTPSRTATPVFTLTPSQTASPAFTMTLSQTATSRFTLTPSLTSRPTFTMTRSQTATTSFTSTSTNTPSDTSTPTATINPLTLARGDGYYLVNVEIAPGTWRNNGTDEHCNWVTTTHTGAILHDYFGPGSGTAYIGPTDFAFQATRCGTWTFLSGP